MGLLLKLENGDTALKSLKFGRDRFGNGSSNQPYIKNPIIDEPGKLSQADNDFLFRNGIKAPINAAEDVARLTKYMFDFKSPSGLLFGIKQNLLSRVAVPNEAAQKWGINTPGAGYAAGALNAGVYTPLSTLLQAGVGFTGTHLNLMGINPFSPMTGVTGESFLPSLGLVRYEDVVKEKNSAEFNNLTVNFPIGAVEAANIIAKTPLISGLPPFAQTKLPPLPPPKSVNIGTFHNRLLDLWYNKSFNANSDTTILQYGGGPGSILGIGKTRINFADNQRTGVNNPLFVTNKKYFLSGGKTAPTQYIALDKEGNYTFASTLNYNNLLGASIQEGLTPFESGINDAGQIFTLYGSEVPYATLSKYNPTGMPLTGSDGYQAQLKFTQIQNPSSLLGASKEEDLTKTLSENELFPEYVSYGISYNPTLSKTSFGLTLSGSGGYQIGKQNHLTEVTDTTYRSAIQEKLKEYGRELLSDSAFDTGDISGDARVWAPTSNTNREKGSDSGKFIAKYSSKNSLIVDPKIISDSSVYNSDFREDINKATLINDPNSVGYLANLNKNSGIYEDPKNPGNYVTQHNPNRVGGRGIAADFRLVNRDKRGFFDPTEDRAYDYITDTSDYSGKTIDRIYYNNSAEKRTSTSMDNGVDLIDFRIEVLNPTSPSDIKKMRFRAYIDSLSDSYSADWKSQTYMGRGEKFWKYNSFDRDMSLGFTVVADSAGNLGTMYTLLDALASTLAPTYSGQGYMAGNIHKITIGDYISNQYGIITGFTYDIIDDSPWELTSGIQLPFYIKVTGFKFTPIHDFRPSSIFNHTAGFGHFIWPGNKA